MLRKKKACVGYLNANREITRSSNRYFGRRMPASRIHPQFHRLTLVAILFSFATNNPIGTSVYSQTIDWSNGTGTLPWYDIGTNWVGGTRPSSSGTARFGLTGNYAVWWDGFAVQEAPSVGKILVTNNGNVTFLNQDNVQRQFTVNGSGGAGSFSDFRIHAPQGATTTLTISGMHLRSLGGAEITRDLLFASSTVNINGGHAAESRLTVSGSTGLRVNGALNVNSGGKVGTTHAFLGHGSKFNTGTATIQGAGSSMIASGGLTVGDAGQGTLRVLSGGTVTSSSALIGNQSDANGLVQISGTNSRLTIGQSAYVGLEGSGRLDILDGGEVQVVDAYVGFGSSSGNAGVVTVSGAGSKLTSTGQLFVGFKFGVGEMHVTSGGTVNSKLAAVGDFNANGLVTVSGVGSVWNNTDGMYIGAINQGRVHIHSGGVVRSSTEPFVVFIGDGGNGILDVDAGGTMEAQSLIAGGGGGATGTIRVHGQNARHFSSSSDIIGWAGNGSLNVYDGGQAFTGHEAYVGYFAGSTGSVTVANPGSSWDIASDLIVGSSGQGVMGIYGGGQVSARNALIGAFTGSSGWVQVGSGLGNSLFSVEEDLFVGGGFTAAGGSSDLIIASGGRVHVGDTLRLWNPGRLSIVGGELRLNNFVRSSLSQLEYHYGTIEFEGSRSLGSDATVAHFFPGNPTITSGKHLLVEGTAVLSAPTTIDGGTLSVGSLQGGPLLKFNSGTFNLTNSNLSISTSGLFGSNLSVSHQQTYSVANATEIGSYGQLFVGNGGAFSSGNLTNYGQIVLGGSNSRLNRQSDTLWNHGLITGGGLISGALSNASSGEIRAESGNSLRFLTSSSENSGEIRILGGIVDFQGALVNQSGGRISGRGALTSSDIQNHGQMLFSGGFTDIYSPVTGFNNSRFIVSGGGTTTVHGSVEMKDGAELRISDHSNAVFFDDVQLRNGALLTGNGNAYFEGGLGIGNSPSRQEFSFNVSLGALSNLVVELGGTNSSSIEFDQFVFMRNLSLLGGSLTIDLISLNERDSVFSPRLGDSFRIFEVMGDWTGQFDNYFMPTLPRLLDWDLSDLYSFGTIRVASSRPKRLPDLEPPYKYEGGNLKLSSVPEPSSMSLVSLIVFGSISFRFSRKRG
jgi:T5SS/PEP-CTERM-associated repeat protein